MTLRRHLWLRATLACMLAVPVLAAPSSAFAVTADSREAGAGDDTWTTAVDLTTAIDDVGTYGWYGEPMSTEARTFDFVDDATKTSDEDWIKFTVTQADYDEGDSYVIEAVSGAPNVDPVIEVYGPGSASPTPPGSLGPSVETTAFTETDPNAIDANDEGRWFSVLSASVSFMPPSAGTYYARIRPYYQYAGGDYAAGFANGSGPYTLRLKTGQMSRISGSTRVDTAIEISKERFSSVGPFSGAVILANAYGFADALSGSTLAGALGCPVLLTPAEALPASVLDEIQRLGADTVYVLGGVAAVEPAVQTALEGEGLDVVRVAGANRTETARKVALAAAGITESSHVAFLANSQNFPDALAASPMATYNVAPVLLTPATTLDPQVTTALQDPALGITDVVIVGGTAAISNTVATQAATLLGGSTHVRRIAGADRFATARDFATWATGVRPAAAAGAVGTPANPGALATLDFNRIGVASGRNFPDALAGGVFCGLAGAPILLSDTAAVPTALLDPTMTPNSDYWFASDLAILRSYLFGGTSALSTGVHLLLDSFTGPALPL